MKHYDNYKFHLESLTVSPDADFLWKGAITSFSVATGSKSNSSTISTISSWWLTSGGPGRPSGPSKDPETQITSDNPEDTGLCSGLETTEWSPEGPRSTGNFWPNASHGGETNSDPVSAPWSPKTNGELTCPCPSGKETILYWHTWSVCTGTTERPASAALKVLADLSCHRQTLLF